MSIKDEVKAKDASVDAQRMVNDITGSAYASASTYPMRSIKAAESNKIHREQLLIYIATLEKKLKLANIK